MQETQVRSLGQEDPLEEEMTTHSSFLAWRIPWTEEPGRLQSMGSQRVGHSKGTKQEASALLGSWPPPASNPAIAHCLPHIMLLPSQRQWITNLKSVYTMSPPPLLCNITHSQVLGVGTSSVNVHMLSRVPLSVAP